MICGKTKNRDYKYMLVLQVVDMLGKKCEACKKGKYQETSIHDDWDGMLHCNKCGHETKRDRKQVK